MLNEELLKRYSEICQAVKSLEEEKKIIGEMVSAHMEELKADKIQSPIGTFSFAERTKWIYTREVEVAKEEMEAIIAKAETTKFLRFQGLKSKE
jgi:hypothetical protein